MAKRVFDDSHKYTVVATLDDVGPGNAHHVYEIWTKPSEAGTGDEVEVIPGERLATISFQNGPIKEAGVNGVMDENLLSIVSKRLEGFQSGPYAHECNAQAKRCIDEALDWLRRRTAQREKLGVEGTHAIGASTLKETEGVVSGPVPPEDPAV